MSKQLTKKQSTLKRIFACIRPYTPLVLLSLLVSVITVALTLYVPILTGHGVDFYYHNNPDMHCNLCIMSMGYESH